MSDEGTTHSHLLPYLLNRVVSLINAPMQRELRRRNMTLTHWRILGFIDERDGLIISELADLTVTDLATLSRALTRLEQRGMIKRVVDPVDTRQFEIHILEPGREIYRELFQIAREFEDWAFREFDPDQLDQLRDMLQWMSSSLTARSGGTAALDRRRTDVQE